MTLVIRNTSKKSEGKFKKIWKKDKQKRDQCFIFEEIVDFYELNNK